MKNPKIVVVDYEMGNILSVKRALEYCGADVLVTQDKEVIGNAQKLVLPGVGAFGAAMQSIKQLALFDAIRSVAENNNSILGICLGMQLLFDGSSEFGNYEGFGFIPGSVLSMQEKSLLGRDLKIPHIGWNGVYESSKNVWKNTLISDFDQGEEMYFVHSYYANLNSPDDLLAYSKYGDLIIPSVVRRGKIYGCQFHPEKSGSSGLMMLRKFAHD